MRSFRELIEVYNKYKTIANVILIHLHTSVPIISTQKLVEEKNPPDFDDNVVEIKKINPPVVISKPMDTIPQKVIALNPIVEPSDEISKIYKEHEADIAFEYNFEDRADKICQYLFNRLDGLIQFEKLKHMDSGLSDYVKTQKARMVSVNLAVELNSRLKIY